MVCGAGLGCSGRLGAGVEGAVLSPALQGGLGQSMGVALLGPEVIAASSCEAAVIHGWRAEGPAVRDMARSAGRGASHSLCNGLG